MGSGIQHSDAVAERLGVNPRLLDFDNENNFLFISGMAGCDSQSCSGKNTG